MQGRIKEARREQLKAAVLAGDLSKIRGEFQGQRRRGPRSPTRSSRSWWRFTQTLTAEQERLLKNAPRRIDTVPAVGGIPVDSEWIIFVIDTSGSMQVDNWDNALNVVKEILDIYPHVKGLQVLSDQGSMMFPGQKGSWLQDTPAQRAQIVARFVDWKPYSKSSPIEGIGTAVQGWWAPDKKISVYVIGDDYTGGSIEAALAAGTQIQSGGRRAAVTASGYMPSACPMVPIPRRLSIRVLLL